MLLWWFSAESIIDIVSPEVLMGVTFSPRVIVHRIPEHKHVLDILWFKWIIQHWNSTRHREKIFSE